MRPPSRDLCIGGIGGSADTEVAITITSRAMVILEVEVLKQ